MAIVQIKNATVTRLNSRGNGFTVEEKNTSGGVEYKSSYKVWPQEASGVTAGAVINVSGYLSAKVSDPREGTDKRYVDLSINSPRIEIVEAGEAQQQEPSWDSAPPADPWGSQEPTPPASNADAPF
jgi:hypothetical protein